MPICSSSSDIPEVCHRFYTPSTRARPEVAVTQAIWNEFDHPKSEACGEDLEVKKWFSKERYWPRCISTRLHCYMNLGFKSRKSKSRRLQMSRYPVRRLEQINTEMTQGKCQYLEAGLLEEEGHTGDDDVCFCHPHCSTATHRDGV